jgi:hypothetical protein
MTQAEPPKGSFARTVRTIGWAFFGIRKKSGYQEDLRKLNPLHVIAVAFVAVALFVCALVMLVHWVAS